MFDPDHDNRELSDQSVSERAGAVSGISGGVLSLLLTLALSVSAVFYGTMMFLYAIRYGHVEPFWFIADLIVPFLIFVLMGVGCWIIYIRGRQKSRKTVGFTLIGTALVIEIFHWLFAWAMSCVSNVGPYLALLSDSGSTMLSASGDEIALVLDIVFLTAGFFFIAALGVQMEVSVHRSVIVPAKALLRGGDAQWRPSRLALGMPVLFAVLMFATEEMALTVLASFSGIISEMNVSGLTPFPIRAMNVYLVSYTIANIIAVIIVARIRRNSRPRKGRPE